MRFTPSVRLLPLALTVLFCASGCPSRIEAPRAVIAAAPADVAVGATVQLDGSGSTDPGKLPLYYRWSFVEVPAGSAATILAAETARPSFRPDTAGTYEVSLVVSNGSLTSRPATVAVKVGTCGTNPPVVNAITPVPATPEAGQTVGLTADVADPDVAAPCGLSRSLSYAWSLLEVPSGSRATLSAATSLTPWFEPDLAGTYRVSLVVTDDLGRPSAERTIDVEVGTCGTHPPVVKAITPAPATPNVGQAVGLSADVSDADVDPPCGLARSFSYAWSLASVPAGSHAAMTAATSLTPWFEPDLAGTYGVSLVVTDDLGRSSAALTVDVAVGRCGATPPVVQAVAPSSPDPAIGQVVQLTTTVSDADASAPCGLTQAFSYAWWIQSAPPGSHAQLNLPTSSNPSFTVDQAGGYVVEVIVTDATGLASNTGSAAFTASACGGNAPAVPSIAPSPAAPGVGSVVQVSPTVTDADAAAPCNVVETFTYAWALVGQPAGSTAFLNNPAAQAPSFVPDLAGDYHLSLVVTDSQGHQSQKQALTITVSECGAAPPTVDSLAAIPASPNTGQPVQLSAAVSDADNAASCGAGQSFTYAWTLLATPIGSRADLHLAGAPQPSLTPDVPGTYTVGLVVTDSTGRKSPVTTLDVAASTCGTAVPVALVGELAPDVVAPAPSIAGPNVAIGSVVQLTGDGSTDADNDVGCSQGQTLSYRWSFLSMPAGSAAVLNNPTVVNPSFTADIAGTFVIGLSATDSTGRSSAMATATVTADPAFGVGVPGGFTITTLASGGVIRTPRGLTEDGNGNIYVVQGNSRITRIAAATNQLSTLTTAGFLAGPNDVAFDAPDNVLFVTAGGNRIIKVALNGAQSPCTGQFGGASFRGIEVYNGTGGLRVIAADRNNGQLDFFNPATCVLASTNDFSAGNGFNLFRPWGVTAANIGGDNVFVTDEGTNELTRNVGGAYANNAGNNTLVSGGNIATPRDVVVTPAACAARKLIVANGGTGELLLFTNAGGSQPVIILTGLQRPVGLFVESQSKLLISDEIGNAVFRLSGNLCSL